VDRPPSGAIFDETARHRFSLWREWDVSLPLAGFILLNPSTAGAHTTDATIGRCIAYARSWGFGGVEVVNIFSLRAISPRDLRAATRPVKPENAEYIAAMAARVALTVAGWGNHGLHRGQGDRVRALLQGVPLHHLRLTKLGQPQHPLYLSGALRPEPLML
jgi:hypothetical protein